MFEGESSPVGAVSGPPELHLISPDVPVNVRIRPVPAGRLMSMGAVPSPPPPGLGGVVIPAPEMFEVAGTATSNAPVAAPAVAGWTRCHPNARPTTAVVSAARPNDGKRCRLIEEIPAPR